MEYRNAEIKGGENKVGYRVYIKDDKISEGCGQER